jgi:large subunit ribosomal protein L4
MKIDVFTATGTKKGSMDLPAALFEAPINQGLMQLAVVRQQSNRRQPIAHARHRGEMVGSTKKLYQQKGTGRARRGPIRSPLMKGGGKSFGPRNERNFIKDMPRKMRRNALFSCLSLRAKEGAILGLENYPDQVKTKTFVELLQKLPVELGRRITVVLPSHHRGLELSARNVPRVKTLLAPYLNPEDILSSKKIIFLVEAIAVAEKTFAEKKEPKESKATKESRETKEAPKAPKAAKAPAKSAARKAPAKPAVKKSAPKKAA